MREPTSCHQPDYPHSYEGIRARQYLFPRDVPHRIPNTSVISRNTPKWRPSRRTLSLLPSSPPTEISQGHDHHLPSGRRGLRPAKVMDPPIICHHRGYRSLFSCREGLNEKGSAIAHPGRVRLPVLFGSAGIENLSVVGNAKMPVWRHYQRDAHPR